MHKPSSRSVKVFSPRYTQQEVLEALRTRMPQLLEHLPVRWVVLFGSYAKGNYTAFSDIDVLVVYAGEPREDAFAPVKRTFGLAGLEPQVLTEEEFRAVLPVWTQMLRQSVTVWGRESCRDASLTLSMTSTPTVLLSEAKNLRDASLLSAGQMLATPFLLQPRYP